MCLCAYSPVIKHIGNEPDNKEKFCLARGWLRCEEALRVEEVKKGKPEGRRPMQARSETKWSIEGIASVKMREKERGWRRRPGDSTCAYGDPLGKARIVRKQR